MSSHSLRSYASPLRTLEPADPDASDLAVVRDLVGQARVLCVGESAHGVREFYQLKDRLLRFLVADLGFTAFVMESGFAEGLAVNDWVLGGEGALTAVARRGITYQFGECEEMRAQLQWMRDWNGSHDRKVRFYGMDVPGSCANPAPAIAACLSRLERESDDAELLTLADLGSQFEALQRYQRMPSAARARLSVGISMLVRRASATGDEIAMRCARSAQVLDELLSCELRPSTGHNPRDAFMADSVRWILKREERIVVGAHNGHILRTHSHPMPVLGQLLTPALGDDMVVAGTTFASGEIVDLTPPADLFAAPFEVSLQALQPPARSIDALMDGAGPLHCVDLRRVRHADVAGATLMMFNAQAYELEPKTAFDALFHVRHVTPTAGRLEACRASIQRAQIMS